MRLFRSLPLVATTLVALAATGCMVSVPNAGPTSANRAPVIQSFTYSPTSGLTKDQAVTFSLVATDPEGQPLQVNWSSTKGTLSGTSGQVISWRAVDINNKLDAGLATVSAIVSDGVQTTVATANIQVMDNGQVTVAGTTTGTATPTTAPASATPASASPAASPSAASSPAASASPEASPSPSPSASASAAAQ